jgi:hypothetical protein
MAAPASSATSPLSTTPVPRPCYGPTGSFDGDDVIRIAVATPASAHWVVSRLWSFSTDFRAVYATLLEGVLGADAAQVLGTGSFPRLPVL